MTDISVIESLLESSGLVVLGVLDGVDPGDTAPQIVLVGNAGSSVWSAFANSQEYNDGQPHPLDRWSRRIGSSVAAELSAVAVFPFDGPPYPPVLDWAGRTGQAFPSPVSMFIHKKYGLWHAYRFALLLHAPLANFPPVLHDSNPCLSCVSRPCLSACPVGAFSENMYRVDDCVAYLARDKHSECRQLGCNARRACPMATEFHYRGEQARFHMDAFLASLRPSESSF